MPHIRVSPTFSPSSIDSGNFFLAALEPPVSGNFSAANPATAAVSPNTVKGKTLLTEANRPTQPQAMPPNRDTKDELPKPVVRTWEENSGVLTK